MLQLLLATRNAHKTHEFAAILGPDFVVSDLTGAVGIPEVEESGRTFAENATIKALAASDRCPGLIVSDDSGLEVAALAGAPGVHSARYAGENASDRENLAKLLAELERAEGTQPFHARFCCTLALAEAGKIVHLFHGTMHGEIILEPRGAGGFGYDPVFVPDGYTQTLAELGDTVKNQLSHRAQAVAQLREYLSGKERA